MKIYFCFGEIYKKQKSPQELYHRFIDIAPSSDSSSLTLNLPFKLILRFEIVF